MLDKPRGMNDIFVTARGSSVQRDGLVAKRDIFNNRISSGYHLDGNTILMNLMIHRRARRAYAPIYDFDSLSYVSYVRPNDDGGRPGGTPFPRDLWARLAASRRILRPRREMKASMFPGTSGGELTNDPRD
jgi:hypothetical protein